MRRVNKLMHVAAVALTVLAIGGSAEATRTAMPRDGSPWPPDSWDKYDYYWGQVINISSSADATWDLTAHLENFGSKTMTIRGASSYSGTTPCYGVATTAGGSVTVGSSVTFASGSCYNGGSAEITTPAVTVQSNGFFFAECALQNEAAAPFNNCKSSIISYRYAQ